MPENLVPADPFTAVIRMIACPDCTERLGLSLSSPNPDHPEVCPTCAGYGDILHPDEVGEIRKRSMGKSRYADLKAWPEYVEGRWSA